MKDIEKLLSSAKRKAPKRHVNASFTNNVLDKINEKEEKGSIFMRMHKKPLGAVLSIAFVLVSGATTFAAVANWPSVVSVFGEEHKLDSGARVVEIEVDGCKPVGGAKDETKSVSYYEIKKESSITNEQAVAMMQGRCEEKNVSERSNELVRELGSDARSTRILTIESKDTNGMTVVLDKEYNPEMSTFDKARVSIDPSVKVTDGVSSLAYEELKVGDSVVLIGIDERGISPESPGYTVDVSKMRMDTILKVPDLTGNPDLFYKHLGKDFVRVVPSSDGKGFDRAYEFFE